MHAHAQKLTLNFATACIARAHAMFLVMTSQARSFMPARAGRAHAQRKQY